MPRRAAPRHDKIGSAPGHAAPRRDKIGSAPGHALPPRDKIGSASWHAAPRRDIHAPLNVAPRRARQVATPRRAMQGKLPWHWQATKQAKISDVYFVIRVILYVLSVSQTSQLEICCFVETVGWYSIFHHSCSIALVIRLFEGGPGRDPALKYGVRPQAKALITLILYSYSQAAAHLNTH